MVGRLLREREKNGKTVIQLSASPCPWILATHLWLLQKEIRYELWMSLLIFFFFLFVFYFFISFDFILISFLLFLYYFFLFISYFLFQGYLDKGFVRKDTGGQVQSPCHDRALRQPWAMKQNATMTRSGGDRERLLSAAESVTTRYFNFN